MAVEYAGGVRTEAPHIEAYKLGLLEAAKQQVAKPMDLPAVQAAGLSGLQQGATGLGQQYMTGGTGVGGYAPYMQGAGQLLASAAGGTQGALEATLGLRPSADPNMQAAQQGMGAAAQTAGRLGELAQTAGIGYGNIAQGTRTLGGAAQGIAGAARGFDPSTGVSAFMNPYQQQVIDESIRQIDRQGDIARQGLAAQAVRTGAFGGTREGVQRAELDRNLAEMRNQTILGGLQSGYGQALGNAMQSFEAQQQRQLGAGQALGGIGALQSQQGMLGAGLAGQQANILGNQAQLYQGIGQGFAGLGGQTFNQDLSRLAQAGQFAGQLGAMGMQSAGLGAQSQALAQGDLNTYLALGGLQQQNAQAQLDAQRATQMQRTMMPYQQIGFLSDVYRGAPTSAMSLTGQTAPSTNPLQSAIGTAMGAIGTVGSARQAGLL